MPGSDVKWAHGRNGLTPAGLVKRSLSASTVLGMGLGKTTPQEQRLTLTLKTLDKECNSNLKSMAVRENDVRRRQMRREERKANLRSYLSAEEIEAFEAAEQRGTRQRNHRQRRGTAPDRSDNASTTDTNVEKGSSHDPNLQTVEKCMSKEGPQEQTFYGCGLVIPEQKAGPNEDQPQSRLAKETINEQDEEKLQTESKATSIKHIDTRVATPSRSKHQDDVKENRCSARFPCGSQNMPRQRRFSAAARLNSTYPPSKSPTNAQKAETNTSSIPDSCDTVDFDEVGELRTTGTRSTLPSRARSASIASTFSCHEERKLERGRERSQSVVNPFASTVFRATTSFFADEESIDAAKKERIRSELRGLMITESNVQFVQLDHRKDEFISDVVEMVNRDRGESPEKPSPALPPIDFKLPRIPVEDMTQSQLMEYARDGVDIDEIRQEIQRRKKERVQGRMSKEKPEDELMKKRDESDQEYSGRMQRVFRELRKVRYLRMDSKLSDFSDVVTLAVDQHKQSQVWKDSIRENLC